MKLTAIVAAFSVCLFSFSCIKPDNYSCNYDACAFVAPAAEVKVVEDYLAANSITDAVKHCSGMYYRIVSPGTGAATTRCALVSVLYKGMLANGSVFDQTTTAPFQDYLSNLIRAWQIGVPLVKEGGKITMYIPSSLGYGSAGSGTRIPGNSMLIFDVTLVATAR
ncbi:MAG: FKBP-type peptidyl-prolyl cis-trans isomerase [Chitinophagaceae bacterium]